MAVVAADKAHLGQSRRYGGRRSLLITGATTEGLGKIIMVGGAVIGLYGLYQYLQKSYRG